MLWQGAGEEVMVLPIPTIPRNQDPSPTIHTNREPQETIAMADRFTCKMVIHEKTEHM